MIDINSRSGEINNGINWEAWGFTIEEIPRRKIITAKPYNIGSYSSEKINNPDRLCTKPSHYAWLRLLREVKEKGAVLHKDWYDYCVFEDWYEKNKYEFGDEEVYLKNGYWGDPNEFSPNTCVFVPKCIVMMLRTDYLRPHLMRKRKYNLPVGINYGRHSNGDVNSGRYIVTLSITEDKNRRSPIGRTDTLEEAFYFYKYMKEKHIQLYAESVKDKIPESLYNYMMKFEWNDDLSKYTEVKNNE